MPNETAPREWHAIPPEDRKSGYWVVTPDDDATWLDGRSQEIVYVYFDGKWSVLRMGEAKREKLEAFQFLYPVALPGDQDE